MSQSHNRLVGLFVLMLVLIVFSAANDKAESTMDTTGSFSAPIQPTEYLNPVSYEITIQPDRLPTENASISTVSDVSTRMAERSEVITPPTTVVTVVYPDGKCSEWYPTAIEAGWQIDELTKLGRILWAESRCTADIANKTYSYGLAQMEWSAHKGWLESEFGITQPEELYDPYINLLTARWLFDYAETHYGCGWQPWYMSGDWC